jgi:hypothetical protein
VLHWSAITIEKMRSIRQSVVLLLLTQSLQATLAMQIPVREGMVICADKRGTAAGDARGYRDSQKLFIVNRQCGFYVAGTSYLIYGVGNRVDGTLDMAALIRTWFSQHSCNNVTWDQGAFTRYLVDSVESFLKGLPKTLTVPVLPGESAAFSTPVIFNNVHGQRQVIEINLTQEQQKVHATTADRSDNFQSNGVSDVVKELLFGHQLTYDLFRHEPAIRTVAPALSKGNFDQIGAADAERFIRRATQITNEHPLPNMTQNAVSPDCNCILLTSQGIRGLDETTRGSTSGTTKNK